MAAFVFPLLVKLLLAEEQRYSLSDDDQCRCAAVDRLLAQPDWAIAANEMGGQCVWAKTLEAVRTERKVEEAFAAAKRKLRNKAE